MYLILYTTFRLYIFIYIYSFIPISCLPKKRKQNKKKTVPKPKIFSQNSMEHFDSGTIVATLIFFKFFFYLVSTNTDVYLYLYQLLYI